MALLTASGFFFVSYGRYDFDVSFIRMQQESLGWHHLNHQYDVHLFSSHLQCGFFCCFFHISNSLLCHFFVRQLHLVLPRNSLLSQTDFCRNSLHFRRFFNSSASKQPAIQTVPCVCQFFKVFIGAFGSCFDCLQWFVYSLRGHFTSVISVSLWFVPKRKLRIVTLLAGHLSFILSDCCRHASPLLQNFYFYHPCKSICFDGTKGLGDRYGFDLFWYWESSGCQQ